MDRRSRPAPVRAAAWTAFACALVAYVFAAATAVAATSTSVVGAQVPSSVSIDAAGCSASASRDLGSITTNASVLTAPCTIQFESSNDSSMLRMVRRTRDGTDDAMKRADWSFTTQRAPTASALQDMDAASATTAWAVGDGGEILATTDGGATWPAQVSGVVTTLYRVDVVDASTAWVVGAGGTVLRTVDGGGTWTSRPPGVGTDLYDVHAIDANEAWIAGADGMVRRTEDGGATWTQLSSSPGVSVEAISVLTPSIAVIATWAPQEIWRTTDRGATWTQVSTAGDCGWGSLDEASSTVVYVGGCGNNLGVSTDAGATWSIRTDGWNEHDDVEAISPQVAYFSDIGAGIDRTYDGLATLPFHPNGVGFAGRVTGLAVPAVDQVWATFSDGRIARSDASPGVSDYSGTSNWGSGGATSAFGVCVESIGGTTIPVWAPDSTGIAGTCEASDVDTWRAVPDVPTKIAEAAAGDTGSIDLVWGLRTSSSQPAGAYFAPIVWEAIAPAV